MELLATCVRRDQHGRITLQNMPNCKVGRVNPNTFNFWLVQGYVCLFEAFSSSLCNRDGAEPRWPGVQHVGLRDKCHMNNTDRNIFLRWVALGAMSLQAQLHPEHNIKGGLLPRSGSQTVYRLFTLCGSPTPPVLRLGHSRFCLKSWVSSEIGRKKATLLLRHSHTHHTHLII